MKKSTLCLVLFLGLTGCSESNIPCDGKHVGTGYKRADVLEWEGSLVKQPDEEAKWFGKKMDNTLRSRGHHLRQATNPAPVIDKQLDISYSNDHWTNRQL